ncbi:hypothetical protein OsI_17243 [Oryza sativa Indica Group]|uniref:Wall-associated receptor kinase galacturonan-binding domain-containing protein n=1 Tax=Oryza sativa subsp. indica TaxID=39946 RepID=B8ATL4_ORYSI|nr:hypothetical protein OsI_17243 [Oryza sativa Indica Group]
MMLYLLLLPLLLLTCIFASYVHSMESSTSKCSNIPIPYPFGILGGNPAPAQGFEITCASSGPMVRINNIMFGILNISLLDGFVSILASATSQQCKRNSSFSLEGTNFTFSDTRNKFTALGCDMVAMLLNGSSGYSGGCASFCSTKSNIIDGMCSGVACCQAPVPKGLKKLELEFTNITGQLSRPKEVNNTPTCGEAFIVEQNSYVFSSVDLSNTNRNNPQYRPVVLECPLMVATVRRRTASCHMPARRTPTAITHQMELDTAAIAPLGFRGTLTCKGPMDAKTEEDPLLCESGQHADVNIEASSEFEP